MEGLGWWILHLSLMLVGLGGYSSHFVDTDAGRLHYLSVPGTGTLPPVVMLHGIGSQAADLYVVAEQLRPYTRKIIALDLPAHGLSEVPVEQLSLNTLQDSIYQGLDRILSDEDPVILFGNSLGGWQALRYALHNPQELSALVLVSPAGAPMDETEMARIQKIFAEDTTQHPENLLRLLFNHPPAWQGVGAAVLQSRFSTPRMQALMRHLNPEIYFDPQRLQQLLVPTLLVWGKKDQVFPVEAPFFKQHLPRGTQVLEPAHFTHSPYLEDFMERELGQLIIGWLADVMPEAKVILKREREKKLKREVFDY